MSIIMRIRWVLLPLRASFSKVDASHENFAAICETRKIGSATLVVLEGEFAKVIRTLLSGPHGCRFEADVI